MAARGVYPFVELVVSPSTIHFYRNSIGGAGSAIARVAAAPIDPETTPNGTVSMTQPVWQVRRGGD